LKYDYNYRTVSVCPTVVYMMNYNAAVLHKVSGYPDVHVHFSDGTTGMYFASRTNHSVAHPWDNQRAALMY